MAKDERGNAASRPDCDGCTLMNRREFLRGAVFVTAGAAALASTAQSAMALPVVAGMRGLGEEKSFPIPAADGAQIDKDLDLILSRAEGKVYAFSLACPHQNTAIKWEADRHRF